MRGIVDFYRRNPLILVVIRKRRAGD